MPKCPKCGHDSPLVEPEYCGSCGRILKPSGPLKIKASVPKKGLDSQMRSG